MAVILNLNEEDTSLLHVINWMEQSYKNEVFVMDINFETGGVCLYGDHNMTQKFRGELDHIMAEVYAKIPVWREL